VSEAAKRLLDRIEALDSAAADNRRRTESYQRMADELVQIHGHATSPDGLITAVVTANGTLQSVTFDDNIRTTPPTTLAAAVLQTVASARVAATRQQAEVIRRGLGDTALLDTVLDADQRLFGDERPADPGPALTPPPQPRSRQDDDTHEDFSVFRGFSRG
jgi:DNA-binding protein YbaB